MTWIDRTWEAEEKQFAAKLNEMGITLEEFTKRYIEPWLKAEMAKTRDFHTSTGTVDEK